MHVSVKVVIELVTKNWQIKCNFHLCLNIQIPSKIFQEYKQDAQELLPFVGRYPELCNNHLL
jgi:hypothetical protein